MIKLILRITLAIISAAIGLIGFVVPFLPGWIFIIIAVALISPAHKHKLVEWLKSKTARRKN